MAQRAGAHTRSYIAMGFSIITGKLVIGPVADPDSYQEYERFTLTINPDRTRTLRTLTRSPKGDLLRDVTQTVGEDWRPIEAYGRLFLGGRSQGTVLRRVVGDRLHSSYWLPGKEPDEAEFDAPPNLLIGYHPVTADAWKPNFYDLDRGGTQDVYVHTVSEFWNGGSLDHGVGRRSTVDFIGMESHSVPAGIFETERFMWHAPAGGELEVWRTGPHHIFVKLVHHARQTLYQLAELHVTDVETP